MTEDQGPDPRQLAYDAVSTYLRTCTGDRLTREMIWQGVHTALDAAVPAFEAQLHELNQRTLTADAEAVALGDVIESAFESLPIDIEVDETDPAALPGAVKKVTDDRARLQHLVRAADQMLAGLTPEERGVLRWRRAGNESSEPQSLQESFARWQRTGERPQG
jgi:hypothetical protein